MATHNGHNYLRLTGALHPGLRRSRESTPASPATIAAVDLYGTALVLEEFGNIIARGGRPWSRFAS